MPAWGTSLRLTKEAYVNNVFRASMIIIGLAALFVVLVAVANILTQLNTMSRALSDVSARLSELHEMNVKLDVLAGVDRKLGETNGTLHGVAARIDNMDRRLGLLDTMTTQLGGVSGALGTTNKSLAVLSSLSVLSDLDRKLDALATLNTKLDTLAGLDLELKKTNSSIATMQQSIAGINDGLGSLNTQLGVLPVMNKNLQTMTDQVGRSFLGKRPRLFGG